MPSSFIIDDIDATFPRGVIIEPNRWSRILLDPSLWDTAQEAVVVACFFDFRRYLSVGQLLRYGVPGYRVTLLS